MKINETNRIGAINPYQRNMETGRQEEQKKSRRKDEVSISPEAMEMLNRSSDTDRVKKIQDLKQQVASGTYRVDADKIAEKLLPYFKQSSES
ncbi:flagellar biosynthesis anti-sigma factor FlgM [Paenibacillus kribbensis]|uniref:Negative regulator of flagellin synthesis n=1 Tax=Paenibacillus kribbensis TaxID=172713 RepID=A0A222WHZ2_9BACL|nr:MULTISPECIES: flagellar biosynthesis anti-sigma factor FlgM [Paenibacillus]ASR45604.1 flagellar biosynthesis anti-sigma factor FlgM [Paenibacillus kribbensis]EHS55374.1 Negative regulator of flagellin synthesis (Anti-sigma-D factor) [Paenibacillus sp. Aloe-11]